MEAREPLPIIATSLDRTFPNGAPAALMSDLVAYVDNEIIGQTTQQNLRFEWPDLIFIVQCTLGSATFSEYNISTILNALHPLPTSTRSISGGTETKYTITFGTASGNDAKDIFFLDDNNDRWTIAQSSATVPGSYYRGWLFRKVPGITMDPLEPWPTSTPYNSVYQSASYGPPVVKDKYAGCFEVKEKERPRRKRCDILLQ